MKKSPAEKFEDLYMVLRDKKLPSRYDIILRNDTLSINLHYILSTRSFKYTDTSNEEMQYLYSILSTM